MIQKTLSAWGGENIMHILSLNCIISDNISPTSSNAVHAVPINHSI